MSESDVIELGRALFLRNMVCLLVQLIIYRVVDLFVGYGSCRGVYCSQQREKNGSERAESGLQRVYRGERVVRLQGRQSAVAFGPRGRRHPPHRRPPHRPPHLPRRNLLPLEYGRLRQVCRIGKLASQDLNRELAKLVQL